MQVTDSTWVPAVGIQPVRKYNRAWRIAAASACRVQPRSAVFRVYCITNMETGQRYVGATKRSLAARWSDHVRLAFGPARKTQGSALSLALRKYGAKSFRIAILNETDDLQVSFQVEKFWIRELGTKIPNGYNMTDGGRAHYRWPRAVRIKMRNTQLARMANPENRKRLSAARTRLQRQRAERRGRRSRVFKAAAARLAIRTEFP